MNTCYELESWQAPDGTYHYAKLPCFLQGTDFGPTLKSYILYQYHQCHVTQPLLLEQLWELGISISSGQLSSILTKGHDGFHSEKQGYCLNDYALGYMAKQSLSSTYIKAVEQIKGQSFEDTKEFLALLESLSIKQKYAIKTITEAALLGHLIEGGMPENMVILSDDAGQFNVLVHALCWIPAYRPGRHVERNLQKIHTYTNQQRQELDQLLSAVWTLYQQLKNYRNKPTKKKKDMAIKSFDAICDWQTDCLPCRPGRDSLAERIGQIKNL
ncbi:Mobile element protein [hydrothermal vent metagenome]|uniref:Mobile element protein n=1 Tax=hydrothermal vent metagenome TaxID=652676 RepID=A0A3B1D367_9ZZZZ